VFATIADVAVGTPAHNDTTGIQGGAAADYYHLTLVERDKLTGIEPGATTDQTKADIDALGIDAETLDGIDSTGFMQAVVQDTAPVLGGNLDCNSKYFKQSNYLAANTQTGGTQFSADYSLGDYRKFTATGNASLLYAGFLVGRVAAMLVDCENFGAFTVGFPAGTKFDTGAAPTFTAAGTDRILIVHGADNVYTVTVVASDIKVPV